MTAPPPVWPSQGTKTAKFGGMANQRANRPQEQANRGLEYSRPPRYDKQEQEQGHRPPHR